MMKFLSAVVCLSISCSCLIAERVVYTYSSSEQGDFVLFIDRDRLNKLQSIDLSKEEAAVPVGKAYRIAVDFLKKKFPKYKAFQLYSIHLTNHSVTESSTEHTAYEVMLYAWTTELKNTDVEVVSATILMDGKPVDFMEASKWDAKQKD